MKKLAVILAIATCFATGSACADGFTLTSSELGGKLTRTQVFNGFGCSGQNQ